MEKYIVLFILIYALLSTLLYYFIFEESIVIKLKRKLKELKILKEDELEKEALRKIIEKCRVSFSVNSRNTSTIRHRVFYKAKIERSDISEMSNILKVEIDCLNQLKNIAEKDFFKVALGYKNTASEVALEAKKLFDVRKKEQRLRIGAGYTPYYYSSPECQEALRSLLIEYDFLFCSSIRDIKNAIVLSKFF